MGVAGILLLLLVVAAAPAPPPPQNQEGKLRFNDARGTRSGCCCTCCCGVKVIVSFAIVDDDIASVAVGAAGVIGTSATSLPFTLSSASAPPDEEGDLFFTGLPRFFVVDINEVVVLNDLDGTEDVGAGVGAAKGECAAGDAGASVWRTSAAVLVVLPIVTDAARDGLPRLRFTGGDVKGDDPPPSV